MAGESWSAVLCCLLICALCAPCAARSLRKRALHLRVTDKDEDYEYPLHPHNTNQKNDRCPPPPQTLPERACDVLSCRSDSECERHKRCCFNGCIYACLESVQPPPGETQWCKYRGNSCYMARDLRGPCGVTPAVLDWLVQPKPRWLGGNGWLLDGPEEALQAEACSTTEDGDEPLHCPTGYECHIINPGSPAEGIPNRGQCIKQRGNSDGRNLRHKYPKDYHGNIYQSKGCLAEFLDKDCQAPLVTSGNYNNVVVAVDKQTQKQLG